MIGDGIRGDKLENWGSLQQGIAKETIKWQDEAIGQQNKWIIQRRKHGRLKPPISYEIMKSEDGFIRIIMRIKFGMNILFALLIAVCLQTTEGYPTFEEYVHDFGKFYETQEDLERRKNIYQERIKLFQTITQYTPGVNNMTDWTDQEINLLKNPKFQIPPQTITIQQDQQTSLKVSATTYPQSLDWRQRQAVTSVKNQGFCGSCWAFVNVAYIESKLIIESNYPITVDLSEQYLVSCTPGSDCTGGYVTDSLKVAAQGGIPYETSFPYNPFGSVSSQICKTKNKITDAGQGYQRIDDASDQTLIKLLQRGPIPVLLSSENWHFYGGGIFSCPENPVIDHAALIVGYTNTTWIVKNQWGGMWGESGYMRLNRSRKVKGTNCFVGILTVYLDPVVLEFNSSGLTLHYALTLISILSLILII